MNYTIEEIIKSENIKEIVSLHPLKKRIEWASEGIFHDILIKDPSYLVRIEVAKCANLDNLEILKNDLSWNVKLEVLKSTNLSFMNFKNIEEENPEIIEEAIKQGFKLENLDFKKNDILKLIILKNKGMEYFKTQNNELDFYQETEEIQKIMIDQGFKPNSKKLSEEVLLYYINKMSHCEILGNIYININLKSSKMACILSGYQVQNRSRDSFTSLFEDIEFCKKCIKKNKYIKYVIEKQTKNLKILAELIRYGYSKENLEYLDNNNKKVKTTLLEYASINLNFDIFLAIYSAIPKHIINLSLSCEMCEYIIENSKDKKLLLFADEILEKDKLKKLDTIKNEKILHI